ncbi:hypothetical protein PanWU01x14_131080 [Parasponia andersonii]|uniref:Uncharacterized protein n=1 Tax=Parasponia andersonii TaxID=3476 RepID=A0A2P5CQW5_PARAD|nr:hypothetical protein PanWU01x14_131080 [Parasponia andersonii]
MADGMVVYAFKMRTCKSHFSRHFPHTLKLKLSSADTVSLVFFPISSPISILHASPPQLHLHNHRAKQSHLHGYTIDVVYSRTSMAPAPKRHGSRFSFEIF